MADDGLTIKPPENFIWRCINGHEFLIGGDKYIFMIVTFQGLDGKDMVRKLPICPFCYVDWIGSHVAELKCIGRADET